MNRKQLIMLLVLVAVVGGAGLILLKKDNESWTPSDTKLGEKLLGGFKFNDVARIHIKNAATELNLVQKDLWRVQERGDYPANFPAISEFLIKAGDLKVVQTEPIGASQLAQLELQEPGTAVKAGTLVEFKDAKGNNLQALLLGKKHVKKSEQPSRSRFGGDDEMADGRWVMLPSDTKNVALISDALANIEPKADGWLNKDFFKVEKIKSISFVSTNATNSWKVSRETENGRWSLANVKAGEIVDTNKLASLGSTLTSPSFADVAADAKPDQSGLDKPLVVTIDTFDSFTYTLKLGKKGGDGNYYLNIAAQADLPKARTPGKDEKPDEKKKLDKEFDDKNKPLQDKLKQEQALEKWTYLVPSWTFDPLVKNRAELMVDKKEEPKAGTPMPNMPPGGQSFPNFSTPPKPAGK